MDFGVLVNSAAKGNWMLWFFQCPTDSSLRKEFWEDLSSKVKVGLPSWVCIGDFNDIVDQGEKLGGRKVSAKSNFFLRNFIFDVGVLDIGYIGNSLTWCIRRGGQANIRERLDKVLVSAQWRLYFDQAGVLHL